MLFILGIIIVSFMAFWMWVTGAVSYKLNSLEAGALKAILVGFVASIISALLLGVAAELFQDDVHYSSGFLVAILAPFLVGYVIVNLFEVDKIDAKKTEKQAVVQEFVEKKEESMSNVNLKKLIRIPVWALYSLILATVVMSFVMLVKIWFPETINEELIWRIILSYGVFLVSALVISNLTDKIKLMRLFENEK